MFRSLHMKLVLILVLLIVSVMAVVGTFLINSVSTFYLDSFYEQVQDVFDPALIASLEQTAAETGAAGLKTAVNTSNNSCCFHIFFLLIYQFSVFRFKACVK